jgi:hypothetical protein
MNLRLILPAAATILLAASCTPYVEPPPDAPSDPASRRELTPEEQEKIKKQREEKRKRDQEAKKEEDGSTTPDGEQAKVEQIDPDAASEKPGGGTRPAPEKWEIPVARPVPDVKGFPPGSLVADPTYATSEKKHFRVP